MQRRTNSHEQNRDWCCLLGVPGAGKTTTIAFIVRALHLLGRSVLVTAYTHTALDNLLLKLRELDLPLLRLGNSSSIHKDLKGCQVGIFIICPFMFCDLVLLCLVLTEKSHAHLTQLAENCTLEDLEAHMRNDSLIVGATCLGISTHPLVRRRRFAYCIVDEVFCFSLVNCSFWAMRKDSHARWAFQAGQITQPVALVRCRKL